MSTELRDELAGRVAQGMLAGGLADTIPYTEAHTLAREVAFNSYLIADEMLRQRDATMAAGQGPSGLWDGVAVITLFAGVLCAGGAIVGWFMGKWAAVLLQ